MRILTPCIRLGALLCLLAGVSPAQQAAAASNGRVSAELAALIQADPQEEITVLVMMKSATAADGSAAQTAAGAAAIEDVPFRSHDARTEGRERRRRSAEVNSRRLEANQAAFAAAQDEVERRVRGLGGRVLYRISYRNLQVVRLRAADVKSLLDLDHVELLELDRGMQGGLGVSVPSVGAGSWWAVGYDGSGVQVAVMDTGVDLGHPTFAGAPTSAQVFLNSGSASSCFADAVDTDDRAGHGTHVAGIAAGRGSGECNSCQAVAKGATLLNRKVGFKDTCSNGGNFFFWADSMASFDSLAAVDVVNFSVGGLTTLELTSFSTEWDRVVAQNGLVATICAGNNGPGQALWEPAIAYNPIAVANVDDRGTLGRGDDIIANSSSRGPTIGGRKKPDLAAPGTSISSSAYNWEATGDYVNFTGTSMAAPHVAGAAALLIDSGITDEKAVKAVLINTAEWRGTNGWDAAWGWGYLDMATAAQHPHGWNSAVTALGQAGSFRLYRGATQSFGKATLVWNRRLGISLLCGGQSRPLNDLNLYAYDGNTNVLVASSVSVIDNVEQVSAPDRAQLVLKVAAACESFASPEPFGIATPNGFGPVEYPNVAVMLPAKAFVSNTGRTITATVTNPGQITAHNVNLTLTLPAGFTLTNGTLSRALGSLGAGATVAVDWGVLAPGGSGTHAVSAALTQDSYGQTANQDLGVNWTVGPAFLQFAGGGMNFGAHVPGREVLPRSIQIQNPTNVNITLGAISVSGDFSVTHDCPGILPVDAFCTATVTYRNTATAPANGVLSVASDTASSPIQLPVSASVLDFKLSLVRPVRTSRHPAAPAQSQMYQLQIEGSEGLQGVVHLGCSGAPAGVSCSVHPQAVELRQGAAEAAVTVQVAQRSRRLRTGRSETIRLKVHATMQGVTRTVELPVTIQR